MTSYSSEEEIPFSSEDEDDEQNQPHNDVTDLAEYQELLEIIEAGQALKSVLTFLVDQHVKKLLLQATVTPGDEVDHEALAIDAVDIDASAIVDKLTLALNESFKLGPSLRNLNLDLIEAVDGDPINLTLVEKLLECGAHPNFRVNYRNLENATPLIIACYGHPKASQPALVKLLIDHGANLEDSDATQQGTPLAYATTLGNYDVCRVLLEKGANMSWTNSQGTSLFLNTAWNGHLNLAKLYLEKGADLLQKNKPGHNALMLAAQRGHYDVCEYLLTEKQFPVDETDARGFTALMLAAENGHLELCVLLLDRGAKIEETSLTGETALIQATYFGHEEISRLLMNRGANVMAKNHSGINVLKAAVLKSNFVELCREAIEKGADVHDSENVTALLLAARHGNTDGCKVLAEHGAQILGFKSAQQGMSALFSAAANGHLGTLKYLLEKAVDETGGARSMTQLVCSERDKNDNSMLFWAAVNDHKDVVNFLLTNGADERDLQKAQIAKQLVEEYDGDAQITGLGILTKQE